MVKSDRIGACNKFFGGILRMPTYMPVVNEDNTLRITPRGIGIRKWPGIKYLSKYLSGTFFCLDVVFYNSSNNAKTVKCEYDLFRLSGIADKQTDFIKGGQDSFNLKARSKLKRFWKFTYLPQPGNYSVTLRLAEGTNKGNAALVYFDALPRDATLWNLQIMIIMTIVGLIIGGLLGRFGFR